MKQFKKPDTKKIIAAIVIIFVALLWYNGVYVDKAPLTNGFVSWTQDDIEVEEAVVGLPVTLNIKMIAPPLGYTGAIKIQIKKDVTLAGDEIVVTKVIPIDIPAGLTLNPSQNIKVTFTPDEATGFRIREYFYKVSLSGSDTRPVYDPTIPGERNGLKVSDQTVPNVVGDVITEIGKIITGGGAKDNQVSLKSVEWTLTPNGVSKAKATFHLIGAVSRSVVIDIRQDVFLMGDNNLITKTVTLQGTNTDISIDIEFAAPNSGEWVFIRAQGIYDLTDREARKAQGTEVQIPTTPSSGSSGTTTQPATATGTAMVKSVQWTITPNGYSKATITFALSGTVSKTVSADIRQNIPLLPDKNLNTQSNRLSGTDTEITRDIGFIAPPAGEWVFLRVSDANLDLTDPEIRRAQGIEVQVPTSTGTSTGTGSESESTPTPTETPYVYQPPPEEPPAVAGQLQVLAVGFGWNPETSPTITVNKGQSVPVYVLVYAKGGAVFQKPISVEIKKDVIAGTDTTYSVLPTTISLASEQKLWQNVGSFTPDEMTSSLWGVRQYFAKASISGVVVIDPTDPNTRPHVSVT